MITLIGVILVPGSVFGGFARGGGHLVGPLRFNELLIIVVAAS
jgi:flagellar motor component MotA